MVFYVLNCGVGRTAELEAIRRRVRRGSLYGSTV